MKQNKFKVIIPSYNNEKWIEPNLASIINQTYTNYDVLYIDDFSTDDTFETVKHIVAEYPNWKVVRNETNMRRGYNVSPHNHYIKDFITDDEDILVFIDGDDWLYDDYVLENLNNLYNDKDYWMTYGKFVCYPSGDIGFPQNTPYPETVHETNSYRKDFWRASHLRTFKWHLYKNIKQEDLIFSKTGEIYIHAEDLATSFPCLEMCPKNRIGVVEFFTYVYNVSKEARDRVENDLSREPNGYTNEVFVRESEVRNKQPYKTLQDVYYITSVMAGGLGNMMFQVATAYALGKEFGHQLLLNPNHVGTLHKYPLDYEHTVFKNVKVLQTTMNFHKAIQDNFNYEKVKLPLVNILLDGYYQSYKYFQNYREEILALFDYKPNVKYNPENKVSIHIRRGDYVNLPDYHHNLKIEYYINAIDFFNGYEFLIFSDDIEWCKQNFIGKEFTFVEGQSDVEDLYLMSQCQHNVIANSTFSWWGAWLNKNPEKIVVYPDKWFGSKYKEFNTADLFPDDWICLTEDIPKAIINLFDTDFAHLIKPNGRYSSVHGQISKHLKLDSNHFRIERGLYDYSQEPFDGISLFTETYIFNRTAQQIKSKYKIGWLLETREHHGEYYNKFQVYKDDFDFVLTHDKELLTNYPDKARFCIFGGTWIQLKNQYIHPKSKKVSIIYSHKQIMTGHKLRHEVVRTIGGIDLYGNGSPRPIKYKEEALVDYRYSIVIENSKTENYFTEKLIDCLLVGTIPIYWGCPNVGDFFDTRGMIIVNSLDEIKNAVAHATENSYNNRMEYIQKNFELANKYAVTEDWMYENIFKNLK